MSVRSGGRAGFASGVAVIGAWMGMAALAGAQGSAPAGDSRTVDGIHIWTDRSVDFFNRETILKSILKPGMTDEEKAVACWRLVNRRIFHFCRPDDNDPVRVLNVYGYALCGTIQHVLVWLAQGALGKDGGGHAGLSSRTIEDPETFRIAGQGWLVDSLYRLDGARAPAKMGHTWCQLYYGGRAHYLDAHAGFYVYTADGKSIASIAELSGDPTLVTDPVKTSEPFMPCDGGRPEFFYRCAGGGSPGGAEKTKHAMALRVRPGETLVFHFDKLPGGFFKRSGSWQGQWAPEYYADGPEHRCAGGREQAYRHYGNGEILFAPDFSRKGFRESLAFSTNVAAQADDGLPGLRAGGAPGPGVAVFEFASPYVMVGGGLEGEVLLTEGSSIRCLLAPGEGAGNESGKGSGKALPICEIVGRTGKQTLAGTLDLAAGGYPYRARIRVELTGGAALLTFKSRIITQLNFNTLPRPLPGENVISFESTADPRDSRLFLEWAWMEAGGAAKVDQRRVESKAFTYSLPVGPVDTRPEENPKYMRWLKLGMEN